MQQPDITRHEPLRRIAVTLHALADLAGYASMLPLPVLWTALWLLRPAEAIARGFVIEMSRDLGVSVGQYLSAPDHPVSVAHVGDSVAAVVRLANRFRLLAELIDALTAMWLALSQQTWTAADAGPSRLATHALKQGRHRVRPSRPWLSYDTS